MIWLLAGLAVLALLVAVGRRPSRLADARTLFRLAGAVIVAALAVAMALRGGWPVSLGLAALSAWLGSPVARRTPHAPSPAREPPMSDAEARSILGVTPESSPAEIEAAWRAMMRRTHPDQGGSTGLAAQVNAARDRLLGKRRS